MIRFPYRQIEKAHSVMVDGAMPYNYTKVLWRPPTHVRFPTLYRFGVGYAEILNRDAGATIVGVGARLDPSRWKAGQWTNATTIYTDDTADAQDADTGDFVLDDLTNNNGFCVFGHDIFNLVALFISTVDVGGAPVRTLEYTQAGGVWGAISNALVMPATGAAWGANERVIAFLPPEDWAPAEAGHGTNVPVGLYGIRVRSTTAPTTSGALARSLSVCQMLFGTSLGAGLIYSTPHGSQSEHVFECLADALVGFTSVIHNQHRFTVNVRTLG
jgi:hypothetical protein